MSGALILLCCGCGSGADRPAGAGRAFLDEKKEVPPRLEWNREVTSRAGGTMSFRVTSEGPFSVTVVTARAYNALKAGNKAFDKADILLTLNVKGATHEGQVTIPAGSSYFIIENHTDRKVQMHLQCFEPK
jgi:hypothetical protein